MNLHTQKRTCDRCMAGKHHKCELGYEVKWYSDEPTGIRARGVPQEKCPKPISMGDYLFAKEYYMK